MKLEDYPILFSYNNGQIGQKICSSELDSVASLNLKRALVSALQVSSVEDNELPEVFIFYHHSFIIFKIHYILTYCIVTHLLT